MCERFLHFIKKHALFDEHHNLLLAISGGVDSMVMWDLVNRLGNKYAVAHCNFKLRGSDSDKDQIFVSGQANRSNTPFFIKAFDTKSYAGAHGLSTQMAARNLRYNWFEELQQSEGFDKILVAHHKDDSVETFFINLVRGSSVKGLVGIRPEYGDIVRPMLCFTREEIDKYAREHQIVWREDISNLEHYYKRNFLRHEVIPRFKELNPNFLETMQINMEKMGEMDRMIEKEVERFVEQGVKIMMDGTIRLNKQKLADLGVGPLVLHELIGAQGFNYTQCKNILSSLEGSPGKTISSETHTAVIDREDVLIRLISEKEEDSFWIQEGDTDINKPINYRLSIKSIPLNALDKDPKNAMLDLDKLSFPLEVRRWRNGDKFRPIGMKGQKLISDLLIDEKVSLLDKDFVFVVVSAGQIVWVAGIRISDEFKVTEKTKKVFHFELNE